MVNEKTLWPMLTVKQAGRLLNVHENTIRRWSDQGILRVYRISKRGDRRFKREDIMNFLGKNSGTDNSDNISNSV
jgi:excisionase family DNA binding protein